MRKAVLFFAVFFIAAAGVICYADASLLKEKDNVQITETVLYGDKAAVEGVTVERNIKYDRYMHWNTTYTAGAQPKQNTVYTFDEFRGLADDADYIPDGIIFNTVIVGGMDMTEDTASYLTGVNRAMWELFCETEPGTVGEATINLADYLDYYEYEIQITLPGQNSLYYEHFFSKAELKKYLADYDGNNVNYRQELEENLHIAEKLTEFFKIPVIENQLYHIAVAKGEDEKLYGWSYDCASGGGSSGSFTDGATSLGEVPENADAFDIWAICAYTDDKCYFTFEPYTRNGKPVDTSLMAGGYGIYCLPYDKENGTIDIDNLAMVYALDPSETVYDLYYDANREELLLFLGKHEGTVLSVIDETSMTAKQELLYTQAGYSSEYYVGDDFLVLTCDRTLYVLAVGEDGFYEKKFECENVSFVEGDNVFYPDFSGTVFDWDGEKLLAGGSNPEWKNHYLADVRSSSGFYLAVFDKNGLVYSGIYESSLDAESPYVNSQYDKYYTYQYSCRPTERKPITVRW